MDKVEVFNVVIEERDYQDKKWGSLECRGHEVGAWLTIMRTHLTIAENLWSKNPGDSLALNEIRKVLAVGVACAEQHGLPRRNQ